MVRMGSEATKKAVEILTGAGGIGREIAKMAEEQGIEAGFVGTDQIWTANVASELAERTAGVKYPSLHVYCESLNNLLREKFRGFSGKIAMAVEIRVTHDRLERVSEQLLMYVEALTNVLERNRGEWSRGLYYAGGYKVELGAVRSGGKNFLQAAKVRFELDASRE